MSHPNRGDRTRRQSSEELADNLLLTLKAMREHVRGMAKGNFERNVSSRLSDEKSAKASAIMHDILALCTAMYDRLDVPSEVGFSSILGFAPKDSYRFLLWAVDPNELDAATRNALTYDAHRLKLSDLPAWLQADIDEMFPTVWEGSY